jgi:hypothetical protein
MQTAGTSLQLIGALVTAAGLLYAWNRASGRFDQWRNSVMSKLGELRAQVASKGKADAHVQVDVQTNVGMGLTRPGTLDERLQRVENELSELPGKTKKAIENAIDEKLAEFDATGRGFAVKDIYWALGGIGLGAFGNALSLVDKLST